jgi:hypothetical protein
MPSENIPDESVDAIVLDAGWHRALPVSTLVDSDGTESGVSNRRQLETPRECQLGKAMQEDNGFALTLFVNSQVYAVCLNKVRLGEH